MAPIPYLPKFGKRLLPFHRVSRQRRHHKLEPRLPVRILRPVSLCRQYLLPPRHRPQRQVQSHLDLIRLRKAEPGNLLLPPPDLLHPCQSSPAQHHIPIRAEPRRLQTRGLRLPQPIPQQGLQFHAPGPSFRYRHLLPKGPPQIPQNPLRVLLIGLPGQRPHSQSKHLGRFHPTLQQVLPNIHPGAPPRQWIPQLFQVLHQIPKRPGIQPEQSVPQPAPVRDYKKRLLPARRKLCRQPVQRHLKLLCASRKSHRHLQLLRPQNSPPHRVPLPKRHLPLAHHRRNLWPTPQFHPRPTPPRHFTRLLRLQYPHQFQPCRIPKRVLLQILPHPLPERAFAHDRLQLPHHNRRFVVDNWPIQSPGFIQISQLLPDRIRPRRPVHFIRRRIMRQQETQLMIDLRKARIHNLGRHEVRHHFLHPDVVEPPHRHQIAEPHVRRLMRDHARPAQQLPLCRGLIQHQAPGVVQNGPGMLHAPELERRDQHKIELPPRIRNCRVLLQPRQRPGMQIKNRLPIPGHLCRVRLPVEHPESPPIPNRCFHLKFPRSERKQISGKRLRLRKADRTPSTRRRPSRLGTIRGSLPARRNVQRQRVLRLQTRLIKTGKRIMRPSRHKQRVQEIVIAVERLIPRHKLNPDGILSGPNHRSRYHQMPVHKLKRDTLTIRLDRDDTLALLLKIQHDSL